MITVELSFSEFFTFLFINLFQNTIDTMDKTEPATERLKQEVRSMKPIVTEEELAPVDEKTDEKIKHFTDIKEKVKDLQTPLAKDINRAEKFNTHLVTAQGKSNALDDVVEEIRGVKKDPASITRCLGKVTEVVLIIEEIEEYIVVLEEIIVEVRPGVQSYPEKNKEVDHKDEEVQKLKKRLVSLLKMVKDEEKKMLDQQQENQDLDKQINDILAWLPTVESAVVKKTPISANYDILKKQQEEHQVKLLNSFLLDD